MKTTNKRLDKSFDEHAKRTWQRMLSGRRLNLIDPSPLDIEIEDIALGLARNTRWNGQTTGPHGWSVAQHSDLVVSIIKQKEPNSKAAVLMAAQLHDAPEYVTHDLITPFKAVVGSAYKEVETRLMQAIHLRFGLPSILPVKMQLLIKKADKIAAATEAIQLAGFSAKEVYSLLGIKEKALSNKILIPLPVAQAEEQFLQNFRSIEASFQLQKQRLP
jgi:5'-deoxynucleotidase YfbR-like HD superfamily hydrolase